MEMSPEMIAHEYRTAANKAKQIEILANLNLCQPRDIAELLREQGEELPKIWTDRLEKPRRSAAKDKGRPKENSKRRRNSSSAPPSPEGGQEASPSEAEGISVATLRTLLEGLPEGCTVMLDGGPARIVRFSRVYDATQNDTNDEVRIS